MTEWISLDDRKRSREWIQEADFADLATELCAAGNFLSRCLRGVSQQQDQERPAGDAVPLWEDYRLALDLWNRIRIEMERRLL